MLGKSENGIGTTIKPPDKDDSFNGSVFARSRKGMERGMTPFSPPQHI